MNLELRDNKLVTGSLPIDYSALPHTSELLYINKTTLYLHLTRYTQPTSQTSHPFPKKKKINIVLVIIVFVADYINSSSNLAMDLLDILLLKTCNLNPTSNNLYTK